MAVMDCIIAAIWFSILTAVICFGIHLLIVHVRYKDKVSVARIILGIVLAVALVLWCGVTAVVWHFDSKQEQKRVEYESRLREPGVDQNGNLWIIVETENNDDIYSYEKGDDILKLIESFENAKSYNVLGISMPYPVQHNWCYQPIDCGECELYKIIRSVGGSQKTVIKYCISVDEDGNIFQTEERGEQPWWVLVSSYKKEIDSVVIKEKDGTKKIEGELFEQFISNLIFLYGSNEACERPENIEAMYNVMIRYKGADRYRELYIDNSMNIYEVSGLDTEKEYWSVFHASPYCDVQWLYDWLDMVEAEEH